MLTSVLSRAWKKPMSCMPYMPYTLGMRKTSVYLADEEAEGLRLASRRSGKSQAELIREAIRQLLSVSDQAQRPFRSMGVGRGGGEPYARWSSDDLYRRVMGNDE